MRRVQTQVGAQVMEWYDSDNSQNTMTALAKVCVALFGTLGMANGLACTQTSVASMAVQIGAGEVYQMEPIEATTCGTLPANTAYTILKQGIQFGTYTTSNFSAPLTAGQSINYLIEAQYADQDLSLDPTTGNTPVVLQFYNSANPSQPWSGPGNSGSSSNTFRDGIISYNIVAGASATTGSQVTPSPGAGWLGLWVITVPFGATSLTSANISAYGGAPFLPSNGLMAAIQNDLPSYAVDTGTVNSYVATYSPAITSVTDGVRLRFRALHANTGSSTFNPNGTGAVSIFNQQHVALTGGEIIAGSDVEVVWNSTLNTSGAWVLLESTGGASQLASGSYGVTPSVNDSSTKVSTTAFANPASSVANSGYVKLPSGIIIQWGSAAFSTSGVANTFPITFPSYCRGIMYCITSNTPVWTTSPTLVGFTCNSTGAGTYPYITIGY